MTTAKHLTEADIDKIMAQTDGVMGAAGHELTDPVTRDVIRRNLAGELDEDETTARILARLKELDEASAA